MAYNLSGIWTNSNGKDDDTVAILHIDDNTVQIIGYGELENAPREFKNIGVGKIDGDKLTVQWTDLPDSKGTALGEVHKTVIEIKSNDRLERSGDILLPSGISSSNKTYGNWERKK